MALKLIDFKQKLEQIVTELQKENISLVLHIGAKTQEIGFYFSCRLDAEMINVPSILRQGSNKKLGKFLDNQIYPIMPEYLLKQLSEVYKFIYRNSERILPEIPKNIRDKLLGDNQKCLLVDDNTYTGKTLEAWKDYILNNTKRDVKTFTISATGNYFPDYYCVKKWCSFEWRLIGI